MTTRFLSILSLLLHGFCNGINAQQISHPIHCGTMQNLEFQKNNDPSVGATLQAVEQTIQYYLLNHPNDKMKSLITIPVVVHVVYNLPEQNIDDSLIASQIDVLNEDYNNLNSDLVKVPPYFRNLIGYAGIHFALATRDPNGNATTGIIRKNTTVNSFYTEDHIKHDATGGDDAWNSALYFNIWVGNLSGGLLGYSQFPGLDPATDGCVIHYSCFGRISDPSPFNYGRTLTHECGHWLSLHHTWGDAFCGDDSIADTPTQMTATFGSQNCQRITCGNSPNGNLYQDFMDYTDDRFMALFTHGQVVRMDAVMNTIRASILSSNGLDIVSSAINDAGIEAIMSPMMTPCINTSQAFTPQLLLKNYGTNILTSTTINSRIDYTNSKSYQWSGSLAAGASISISLPDDTSSIVGDHIYYTWTSNPNGSTDANTTNDRRTCTFITKEPNFYFPFSMDFEATSFPPSFWALKNYDCTIPWQRTTAAAHSGNASALMMNFNDTSTVVGHLEDMVTQPINLTGSTTPSLYFWVAYAPPSISVTDTLEVLISSDCNATFTSIYKKWGSALGSVPTQSTAFIPNPFQWRQDSIDLTPYFPSNNVIFIFRNINNKGNNLYLDDINVIPTGMYHPSDDEMVFLFPNPSNGMVNLGCRFNDSEQVSITINNVLGQSIYQSSPMFMKDEIFPVNLQKEAKGVYIIQLKSNTRTVIKKLVLN